MRTIGDAEPNLNLSVEENVYLPTESYGWCEGKKGKCLENGYLADGLCVKCWDKKMEKRVPKNSPKHLKNSKYEGTA